MITNKAPRPTDLQPAAEVQPPRLRRKDAFFGIHFDMHARPGERGIGLRTTPDLIERLIRKVRPDYLQCDGKGHTGISSYPTKAGHPAPELAGDPLWVWRQATARQGVGLFVHYSGVLDAEAVRRRPDWARMAADGTPDPGTEQRRATSVFGGYADELLILQLKELCEDYEVDGVWMDGECWGCGPDYRPEVLESFRRTTGIAVAPRQPGDPGWHEFQQFCREGFRAYLGKYVDALHACRPSFQIASNWAFSSFMPEPVSAGVDFLSGDFSQQNSVNSARWEGRFLASQGLPWDLMAWSSAERCGEGCPSTKSAVQLHREAAVVLALGGGFQAYFRQRRDGSIYECQTGLMASLARFCRARQAFCHRTRAVPQIALLVSTEDYYRRCQKLFGPWDGEYDGAQGILRMLLDSRYAVELHADHTLIPRLREYPLIVVPETEHLAPGLPAALKAYVKEGGRLLAIGPRAARGFAEELGVVFSGEAEVRGRWIDHCGEMTGQKTLSQDVVPKPGTDVFGQLTGTPEPNPDAPPAATVRPLGKGVIAGVYLNLGERYLNGRVAFARQFLADLTRRLFPEPMVEITGSPCVDVTLQRRDGALCINLVNTSGPHDDPNVYVFDHIEPVGPLRITLRAPKPERITVQPGGRNLPFAWEDGVARFRVARLSIHVVLVVEFSFS